MKTLYIVRHSLTIDNQRLILTGGDLYAPLSKEGIQACKILQATIQTLKIDCVFSSPCLRAIQTCELSGFKIENINIEPLIAEKSFGEFEGKPIELYESATKELSTQELYQYIPPGGESFSQLQIRACQFLNIVHNVQAERVAIYSHASFNRALIASIKGAPFATWLQIPQENGGITKLDL